MKATVNGHANVLLLSFYYTLEKHFLNQNINMFFPNKTDLKGKIKQNPVRKKKT